MKVFVVKNKEYEFDFNMLFEHFEVYAKALNKMVMQDMVTAGSIIVDACYQGDIVSLKKDTILYASLCIQAAGELEIYEAEIKKNS